MGFMLKKITVILLLVVLAVLGCSCQNNEQGTTETGVEVSENSVEIRIAEVKKEFPGPILPTNSIYVNEECGYQLEFPQEWAGWYFVNDNNPQAAVVRFYGKSMRGTVLAKTFSEDYDYGLTMFFILSEAEVNHGTYDSVTHIGTSKGVRYYFATTTDVSLSPLKAESDYWFDLSESECRRTENDWTKAQEMMEFYGSEDRAALKSAFSEI